MTGYTYDSVTTIRDDVMMLLSVVYMQHAMNDVSSDGCHTNGNNTTTSSYSLLDSCGGAAVAVASPRVRDVYST